MFEKIYGHQKVKKILENMVSEEKISHAYLFFGRDGIGKKKIALEFAKNILKVDELETCVDFKYISKYEDKKEIIVEQIRKEISENVNERPISCNKKVYIIDEAHLMNDISQNALLKTLEEPPEYIVIILIVSNISSLLPTILSRVNKIEFSNLSAEDINEYVSKEAINISSNILDFVQGSIGKLNYIINESLNSELDKIDNLIKYIEKKDVVNTFLESEKIDFTKNIYLEYLEYRLFANKYYVSALEIQKAIKRLKKNGNYDIVIDNMLLRCIESL